MKHRMTKASLLLSILFVFILLATGCGEKSAGSTNNTASSNATNSSNSTSSSTDPAASSDTAATSTAPGTGSTEAQPDPTYSSSDDPIVTIQMKSGQEVQVEL